MGPPTPPIPIPSSPLRAVPPGAGSAEDGAEPSSNPLRGTAEAAARRHLDDRRRARAAPPARGPPREQVRAAGRHQGEEAGADDPEAASPAARYAAVPHLPLQARQGQRLREARRVAPEQVGHFVLIENG